MSTTLPPFVIVRERDLDSLVDHALGTVDALGWPRTPVLILHAAAATLISSIMGKAWALELQSKTPNFIRRPNDKEHDSTIAWISKLWRLADTLYAVHRLEHVSDRLERLRGPNLEGTVAELAAIERLHVWSPVWLRPESLGGYDADVMLDDGTMCALEVKCRLEETENTSSGVLSRLRKARRQLPDDRPSLVWVRYAGQPVGRFQGPTMRGVGVAAVIETAVQEFLRNTRTVSAVMLSAERPLLGYPEQRDFLIGGTGEWYVNEAAHPSDAFRRLVERQQRFRVQDSILRAPVLRACHRFGIPVENDDLPKQGPDEFRAERAGGWRTFG